MEQPIYVSRGSAVALARWRAEVEALPIKLQDKWHVSRRNEDGTARRIRFRGGHFQIKVLANTTKGQCLLPADGWAPVIAEGESLAPSQVIDTYGAEVLHMIMERFGGFSYGRHPQSERLFEAELRGGVDARDAEFRLMMMENSTGHHHRNKRVSIPVAPGQPVRG